MFAIIDTETTGGNPVKDRVMEIAIIVHNGKRVIEQFSTLINPKERISPFIVALTGISDDMVADAPAFEEVADKVLQMTEKCVFVAHNVRFDYGVVRNEFRRMGVRFQRKQLCTVKLSKRVFPELPSYSLGKICKQMEIPIDMRHRAFGDAEATAVLFEKLLFNDRKELVKHMLEEELEIANFPPNLAKDTVDDLPEETGVYYFLDNKGKVLYVGKSKNIRKRVISHFGSDLEKERFRELKEKIYDVNYELTGSELIAFLMESDEIKRFMPPFNIAQRRRKYRYGIYHFIDDKGYINLKVDNLKMDEKPVIEFTNLRSARGVLARMIEKHGLRPEFCHSPIEEQLPPSANGHEKLAPGPYNRMVKKVLHKYEYKHSHFFIISEGRSHHEQSIVWIEDGEYKGFGYFEPEFIENDIQSLKESVRPYRDNPDVHRILRNWLQKKTKDEIIVYEKEEV